MTPFKISIDLYTSIAKYFGISGLRQQVYLKYGEYLFDLKAISALLSSDEHRILDLGTGRDGHLHYYLASKYPACRFTLTDIYFEHVRQLSGTLNELIRRNVVSKKSIDVVGADITQLPFADNTFSLVTAISVLEHIPNQGDTACIREIARCLRNRGVAYITVPFTFGRAYESRVQIDGQWGRKAGDFYEWVCDEHLLNERLISPAKDSGLSLVQKSIIYENIPYNAVFTKLLKALQSLAKMIKMPLSLLITVPHRILMPFIAPLCFTQIDARDKTSYVDNAVVCLTFIKNIDCGEVRQ